MNKLKSILGKGTATLSVGALSLATFASGAYATPAEEAQTGLSSVNPDSSGGNLDLYGTIGIVLNAVFGVVGILAVVMIIIGGVNYAISMGDPGKVAKAKNTILYGLIGLVVVLLSFAIVNFVLNALRGGA